MRKTIMLLLLSLPAFAQTKTRAHRPVPTGMLYGGHFYYMFDDGYWFLQSKTLDAADIPKFTAFEKYLLKIKKPAPWMFCTTSQHYIVRSSYIAFEATDGGCQWEGFSYLAASWFGQVKARPHFSDCLF